MQGLAHAAPSPSPPSMSNSICLPSKAGPPPRWAPPHMNARTLLFAVVAPVSTSPAPATSSKAPPAAPRRVSTSPTAPAPQSL